jgi:hypothetical protein
MSLEDRASAISALGASAIAVKKVPSPSHFSTELNAPALQVTEFSWGLFF